MYLLADIGGTNARLALVDPSSGRLSHFQVYAVADYTNSLAAFAEYLDATDAKPSKACIAVAGPVTGPKFKFTNSPWVIDSAALKQAFGIAEVKLINDYEAQALGLPALQSHEVMQIGGPDPKPGATKVVLGPGTGLGIGALVQHQGHLVPVMGEGGHVSFAPQDETDLEILRLYWQEHPRVSAERILAGFGLVALYRLMAKLEGRDEVLTAPDISEQALAGVAFPASVVDRYLSHLGAYLGDFAVSLSAYGGVYLTGGVALALKPLLNDGALRKGFENKGRMSDMVRACPLFLITTNETPFRGAFHVLQSESRR